MTKIAELEAQMQSLQAQLEELKAKKSSEEKKETPWALAEVGDNCFGWCRTFSGSAYHTTRLDVLDVNAFKSEEVAQGFANAFRVMILLRQCEGAGERDDDGDGWIIDIDGDVVYATLAGNFQLCPPFPDYDLAEAAANSVGIENIMNAYKFLANAKD